jgi:hypothetical protein
MNTPKALMASTRRRLQHLKSSRASTVIGVLNVMLLFLAQHQLSHSAELVQNMFHTYYQPLLPFLVMLWGWGLNVMYFERTGLQYEVCFDLEGSSHRHASHAPVLLSAHEILGLSNTLTFCLLSSALLFLRFAMDGSLWAAAIQPVVLYLAALLVLLMPFPIVHRDARKHFVSTLWEGGHSCALGDVVGFLACRYPYVLG